MTDDLLGLRWEVPKSGFRWGEEAEVRSNPNIRRRTGRTAYRPVPHAHIGSGFEQWHRLNLVENDTSPEATREPYNPFQESPPLFRTFAATELSPEGMLRFATRYGLLGIGRPIKLSKGGAPGRTQVTGESFYQWVEHITAMRNMVHLWDLCKSGNVEGLTQHVECRDLAITIRFQLPGKAASDGSTEDWSSPTTILRRHAPIKGLRPESPDDTWFARLTPGDVLLPAILCLQRAVNKGLESRAPPQLLWSPGSGTLDLYFRPVSLLNMLWLQLAADIKGKVVYHPCLSCDRWVQVGPDGARASRQYCSNACRTQGLRRRQNLAKELFASGKSVEEIAVELLSEVKTITRWVSDQSGAADG